jgi:phospholipase C
MITRYRRAPRAVWELRSTAVLAAALIVAGCSSTGRPATSGSMLPALQSAQNARTAQNAQSAQRAQPGSAKGKITHVIIVIQENRSFDNLFQGYKGANTVPSGLDSQGETIQLQPTTLETKYDVDHSAIAMFLACDGTGSLPGTDCRMDGFNLEGGGFGGPQNPQYVYVPHNETKPYFDMADEWVLADNLFASQLDESFVAHQYLIGAQATHSVNIPNGPWGCDGGPTDTIKTLLADRTLGDPIQTCFNHKTLGDELDDAGLTWRFYTSTTTSDGGIWSGYQAIKHIRYGPDWAADVITPQTQFFTDVANGFLPNVTWITPTCVNSDHPNCGGNTGPSWVASIVNTVGQSQFWDSSAIFVIWDDWGGLYDHVPPPFMDYDGLGFRIPVLMISPYAKKHHVSHVQYETSSILRFTEDMLGLPRLSKSDRRAVSPAADNFRFNQPPRPFVAIKAPFSKQFFVRQPLDHRRPDDQ